MDNILNNGLPGPVEIDWESAAETDIHFEVNGHPASSTIKAFREQLLARTTIEKEIPNVDPEFSNGDFQLKDGKRLSIFQNDDAEKLIRLWVKSSNDFGVQEFYPYETDGKTIKFFQLLPDGNVRNFEGSFRTIQFLKACSPFIHFAESATKLAYLKFYTETDVGRRYSFEPTSQLYHVDRSKAFPFRVHLKAVTANLSHITKLGKCVPKSHPVTSFAIGFQRLFNAYPEVGFDGLAFSTFVKDFFSAVVKVEDISQRIFRGPSDLKELGDALKIIWKHDELHNAGLDATITKALLAREVEDLSYEKINLGTKVALFFRWRDRENAAREIALINAERISPTFTIQTLANQIGPLNHWPFKHRFNPLLIESLERVSRLAKNPYASSDVLVSGEELINRRQARSRSLDDA